MGKPKVMRDLRDLKGLATLVPQPELPKVELVDNLTELEAQAEIIRESAEKTQSWVRSTLAKLETVKRASRETQELLAQEINRAQEGIERLLRHEMHAYRRASWLGLLEREFSQELSSRSEVEKLLNRMVKEGRLVEDPAGDLRAYGQTYSVSPDSSFGEPENAEAKWLLVALLSRVFQEVGKAREKKTTALRSQGSLNLGDLLAGKPGIYVVEIAAEKTLQNGQEFWRGGGTLFIEYNGQDIKPLDANGSIEVAIEEARKLGVFLRAYTLTWDKAPIVPGLDQEKGRKVQLLWHLLKRAIRDKEKKEQKAVLAGQANLSPEEFFLERKEGICLVELRNTWQNPNGSAGPSDLSFLVERKEKGIRIVDAPEHLSGFFAECFDEHEEEGKKFEGCPQPLQAVLQAIYGQVLRASQDANKTNR